MTSSASLLLHDLTFCMSCMNLWYHANRSKAWSQVRPATMCQNGTRLRVATDINTITSRFVALSDHYSESIKRNRANTPGVEPPMVPSIFLYSSPSPVISDLLTQQPTCRCVAVTRWTNALYVSAEWTGDGKIWCPRLILQQWRYGTRAHRHTGRRY